MVATDVASRGIGMIRTALPFLPVAFPIVYFLPLKSCDIIALISLLFTLAVVHSPSRFRTVLAENLRTLSCSLPGLTFGSFYCSFLLEHSNEW